MRVIMPKPREAYYYPEPYFFVAVDEFKSNIITVLKILLKKYFVKYILIKNLFIIIAKMMKIENICIIKMMTMILQCFILLH